VNKKRVLLLVLCIGAFGALLAAGIRGWDWAEKSDIANFMRSFTILIDNESDFDIMALETGIVNGSSTDRIDKAIASGGKAKFEPVLELHGEGAVYLKYTDPAGSLKETIVCGYTEYLAGSAKVTITNDGADVEMKCY
jgi:hypothetical protein